MTWPMEKEAEMAFTFKVMSMIICIITRFHLNTSCRWRKKTMMEPFLCYKVHKEVSLNFVKMMHNTVHLQEMSMCTLRKVIRGSKELGGGGTKPHKGKCIGVQPQCSSLRCGDSHAKRKGYSSDILKATPVPRSYLQAWLETFSSPRNTNSKIWILLK